jgi:hypothetical protein
MWSEWPPLVDVLQIGARNMQNFELLRAVGQTRTPVLLKRGMSATIDEWLAAAEYILAEGNPHVILGERGIRTFEPATRNTLDLTAIRSCVSAATCPSSSTRRTRSACDDGSLPSAARLRPSARMASWSKFTPIRTTRSATASKRSRFASYELLPTISSAFRYSPP